MIQHMGRHAEPKSRKTGESFSPKNPEIEKFQKISSEYESLLQKYKQRNNSILSNLNKNGISPQADLVEKDQEEFRSNVLKMDNAFSTYSIFTREAEMGETLEHKGPQLVEVLNRLGNNLVTKHLMLHNPVLYQKQFW